MNKSIGVIGGLAAIGAVKHMINGSKNDQEFPDCSGATGDYAFDIFEGPFPKTWFSLALDNLIHPKVKGETKQLVQEMYNMVRNSLYSTIGAGLNFRESVLLGTNKEALEKVKQYFLRKRNITEQEAERKTMTVARHMALLMSEDQTKQAFTELWYWVKNGSNIAVIGPNMQAVFENTSLANIRMDDIKMPFETMYIALPGFDGYTYDVNSGYHCIRGIVISVVDHSIWSGDFIYRISIWSKPKYKEGQGYDDLFLYTGIPDIKSENLEEFIASTFRSPDFSNRYSQPESCINDVVRAVKLAFNLLMYWSTVNTSMNLVHPDLKKKLEKIRQIEAKNSNLRRKSTKRRKNDNKIAEIKRSMPKENFFWIEKGDHYFTRNKGEGKPLSGDRSSPRIHIRSGHWRVYNKDTVDENIIWIEPMLVGSGGVAPRFWKSRLSKG